MLNTIQWILSNKKCYPDSIDNPQNHLANNSQNTLMCGNILSSARHSGRAVAGHLGLGGPCAAQQRQLLVELGGRWTAGGGAGWAKGFTVNLTNCIGKNLAKTWFSFWMNMILQKMFAKMLRHTWNQIPICVGTQLLVIGNGTTYFSYAVIVMTRLYQIAPRSGSIV